MLKLSRNVILIFCSLLLNCIFTTINAQNVSRFDAPFTLYGNTLDDPLAGGLNAPQFSAGDLNNDGIDDLYIFDRIGSVHLTFINEGTANATSYNYAPEYAVHFPDSIKNFCLLRDYDGDGIQDIFSYSVRLGVDGIAVYKGSYNNDNELIFTLVKDLLTYPGLTNPNPVNLAVLRIDIPAIDDIDCDGDLDVLTFDIGGGNMDYYENLSVEMNYGRDSLIFRLDDNCWGGFYESGFNTDIELAMTAGDCANFQNSHSEDRHAGSTTLSLDLDNDDDKEIILGDVSFSTLTMLTNGGDCSEAFMVEQDNTFPSYDSPVNIPIFPASFYLDLDNDGLKDLVASPNNTNSSEDDEVVWFYKNITNNEFPTFQLQQKDLIVNQMIDFGTGTNPTFVDYNADGLQDLVVGTFGFNLNYGERDPRLFLFENIGTATQPAFELVNANWLDFSQFSGTTRNFTPNFGDLDSDGDLDLLVGEEWGSLFYAENIAGEGNPMEFGAIQPNYMNLDAGLVSTPFIVDINVDGLNDIVIGERNGNINYFQNEGTATNPVFYSNPDTLNNTSFLGSVDTRDPGYLTGYSAPVFIDKLGTPIMISGSESGGIKYYDNLMGNTNGTYDKVYNSYGSIKEGQFTRAAVADLNNDGYLEMIVGNHRGGLSGYSTDIQVGLTSAQELPKSSIAFNMFPNPATSIINIELAEVHTNFQIKILNTLGQVVLAIDNEKLVNVSTLASGVYFVNVNTENGNATQKILIE